MVNVAPWAPWGMSCPALGVALIEWAAQLIGKVCGTFDATFPVSPGLEVAVEFNEQYRLARRTP